MKLKLLSLLLVISMAGCGGSSEPTEDPPTNVNTIVSEENVENNVSASNASTSNASTLDGEQPQQLGNTDISGGRNGGSLLIRFDENGDGVLQPDEVPDAFDFAALDANADNVLDESEVAVTAGGAQGAGLQRGEGGLLIRFDENGDGVLQPDEVPDTFDFAALDANADNVLDESEMVATAGGAQGASLQRGEGGLLARFDADQDGLISEAEAPAEWAFGEYDVNGDSFIDAEEMTQIRPGGNRATGN